MKEKVSKKEIKENFRNVISVGYCDLEYLLNFKSPEYYSCGVYGWSCDYYVINNNTIISTGYSPIGNISNYELTREYDKKARDIGHSVGYEEKEKKLNELLDEYVNKILNM